MLLAEAWEVAVGTPEGWRPAAEVIAALDDPDAADVWFRTRFEGEGWLHLDGIATLHEVLLDGGEVARGQSMYERHVVRVAGEGEHELRIVCRALAPELAVRRKPRARWRTQIADANLRFFRTALLGRMPGVAPGPPVIGPWRPVRLEARPDPRFSLRARLDGDDGVLVLEGSGDLTLSLGAERATGQDHVELRIPGPERWWPHTHGEPVLHDVQLTVDGVVLSRRVGFRSLRFASDVEVDGLELEVNDVGVFARGAVWTPVAEAELRATLERVRDAGMNMVRVPGIAPYESVAFHDLCDELGILVWQDFAFANFDYPVADEGFRATVEAEAAQVMADLGHRPSLTVLCGGSEVEQQVAMLGLDPALARGDLSRHLLPDAVRAAQVDAAYVPSAPCGGDLPFRTDVGIANFYGVGAYRRPLAEARRAGVRFAAECLAFANVPDAATVATVREGVPRDAGAGWDFADVRDHYLAGLFGVDPAGLRSDDPERYLTLSAAVSGEVMAELFGEWRRAGSPCGGGLVLWLRDLAPGSGWGLLDHLGVPKVAWQHLRRALAPVAVWMTDEGLGGIDVHVANDGARALAATLRVALFRDGEHRVDEVSVPVEVAAHGALSTNVETLLGRFVDVNWAYRFGPPAQDVVVASLERGGETLGQAFRFPVGRPLTPEAPDRLGLVAALDGDVLTVASRRVAYGVRIHAPGFAPSDDAFCVEPGGSRAVRLRPSAADAAPSGVSVTALNGHGSVRAT